MFYSVSAHSCSILPRNHKSQRKEPEANKQPKQTKNKKVRSREYREVAKDTKARTTTKATKATKITKAEEGDYTGRQTRSHPIFQSTERTVYS